MRANGFSNALKNEWDRQIQHLNLNKRDFSNDPKHDFVRQGVIGPGTVINSLTYMSNKTLWGELFDSDCPVTESAFVQARDKTSISAANYMLQNMETWCRMQLADAKGQRIYAIDGSDFYITPEKMPADQVKESKGHKYSLIHLHAMLDVKTKRFAACKSTFRYGTGNGEIAQAISLVDSYSFKKGDIVVMDRGYCSLNLIRHLTEKGCNVCLRGRSQWLNITRNMPDSFVDVTYELDLRTSQRKVDRADFRAGRAIFVHSSDWDYEPQSKMRLRFVRFQLPGGGWETLVTTLMAEDGWTIEKLAALYHIRWNIETAFRHLKYTCSANSIHAKKPDAVCLEIIAKIIQYNLCQAIVSAAVQILGGLSETQQINVSRAIHVCLSFLRPNPHPNAPPENLIGGLVVKKRVRKSTYRDFRCEVHSITYLHRAA